MQINIITVSQLTNQIKYTLEKGFASIRVEGEISNFKEHSSGHRYFSIKDSNAQIACTMWKSRNLNFIPKDGMKVIVSGSVTVYPPRGSYQMDVSSMQPLGQGDLYLAFEALKDKLSSQGYFDIAHKKAIPALPMKIGVSTSPTGAAVRDILSTTQRRFPAAEIIFRPTLVQGEGAAEDIARAIEELNASDADVLIIGRGGGSLEDLWCYNTEIVANAIYNSKKPIISGVGHETDFTISDFVADHRAATPTAAAEMATPITIDKLFNFLDKAEELSERSIRRKINNFSEQIEDLTGTRFTNRMLDRLKIYQQSLDSYEMRMNRKINSHISSLKEKLTRLEAHGSSLHPMRPLDKGFALLYSGNEIINNDSSVFDHKKIKIVRKNEEVEVSIPAKK
jgi:exodeoxyribonuclease VII large subunit